MPTSRKDFATSFLVLSLSQPQALVSSLLKCDFQANTFPRDNHQSLTRRTALKNKKVTFTLNQKLLAFCAAHFLKTIKVTLRWQQCGLYDDENRHWSEGEPVILAFWHGQQLMMPWIYRRRGILRDSKVIYALVSEHGDGRLAAALLENLSIKTVGGSSSKGGAKALITMSRRVKAGQHAAICPDGPKGPHQETKPGIIKLASITGAPIVPIAFQAKDTWSFSSWDSMFIPKPFSKARLHMGERIHIEPDLSKEELGRQAAIVTQHLHALNDEVSTQMNR